MAEINYAGHRCVVKDGVWSCPSNAVFERLFNRLEEPLRVASGDSSADPAPDNASAARMVAHLGGKITKRDKPLRPSSNPNAVY